MEHVHHKHPHDQGGERRLQEHGAGVVSLRGLPRLAEDQGHVSANEESERVRLLYYAGTVATRGKTQQHF